MRVNWCHGCGGGRNFGDQLGPILLRHYGIAVEWSKPADAQLVCAGSILSKVPDRWRGTVLGTGFIQAGYRRDLSRARVLAVRGDLTRRACGLPGRTALGDPGILVPDLPRTSIGRTGTVIVPHYVDRDLVTRHRGIVAPITSRPDELLGIIAAADLVVTSSLHGLIAADALGIPHVLKPHDAVTGGLFKFLDYASAFGETIRPGVERLTPRPAMAARQDVLRSLFAGLA
jgi:hypothetical protein